MTDKDQTNVVDTATTKSEKASWKRKQKNVDKLVAEVEELEEQIQPLMVDKIALIDRITVIRKQMIAECIHPVSELAPQSNSTILCKFCNKELGIVQRPTDD